MSGEVRTRLTRISLVVTLSLTAALLAGCLPASSTAPANATTALANLPAARAALSTTAPDAKLLVIQTAQAVTPTATPVWGYLFGSPSTDNTYIVYVSNGRSMGAQAYGKAGLKASDWAKVPTPDAWKVDSDAALAKALPLSGAKGAPTAYIMGLLMYKPATDTSTVEPFVWNVQFDPGSSGATTKAINVNATTGAVSVSK